eukprot:maker-scaffold825_size91437-snap-gene-0.14 protein:Tk05918 transcript:maker-scaffold825_size91437-snap-gene-0.14-mRNA-1 annotation:"hypothetical protein"
MKLPMALLLLTSVVLGQVPVVPTDNCTWRGVKYGTMVFCEANEVVRGACGSGKDDNCGTDIWHSVLCCDTEDYFWTDCVDYNGSHGQDLSCPFLTQNPNSLMEGLCGSGEDSNCNGSGHTVKCCQGGFTDGSKLSSTNICYWKLSGFGEFLECDHEDEAVFGRCGSGRNDDCGPGIYHGIECCQITKNNVTLVQRVVLP